MADRDANGRTLMAEGVRDAECVSSLSGSDEASLLQTTFASGLSLSSRPGASKARVSED